MKPVKDRMVTSSVIGVVSDPACWSMVWLSISSTSAIHWGTSRAISQGDLQAGIAFAERSISTSANFLTRKDSISTLQRCGKVEGTLEHILGCSAVRAVCLARIHFASIHGGSKNGG